MKSFIVIIEWARRYLGYDFWPVDELEYQISGRKSVEDHYKIQGTCRDRNTYSQKLHLTIRMLVRSIMESSLMQNFDPCDLRQEVRVGALQINNIHHTAYNFIEYSERRGLQPFDQIHNQLFSPFEMECGNYDSIEVLLPFTHRINDEYGEFTNYGKSPDINLVDVRTGILTYNYRHFLWFKGKNDDDVAEIVPYTRYV